MICLFHVFHELGVMPELDKIVVVFIDDILSYSKNKQNHVENMYIVLQQFRNPQLYANFFQG